jgi:hypothetical protein
MKLFINSINKLCKNLTLTFVYGINNIVSVTNCDEILFETITITTADSLFILTKMELN